jgi:hypothetical protein
LKAAELAFGQARLRDLIKRYQGQTAWSTQRRVRDSESPATSDDRSKSPFPPVLQNRFGDLNYHKLDSDDDNDLSSS